jgi:putative ABC transport system permease protein
MPSLAVRNLFQNKLRLTSTLTGIVFALVLMVVQLGLFLGFARTTSNIIDHSGADLWIASKGVPYFDVAAIMPERKFYQVMAVPGVAKAEKLIVRFSTWKKPRGGEETIEVVGFNPDTRAGGPWDLESGDIEDLRQPDTVLIDESYRDKLGVSAGNELVEINGRRARVVGFTRGIRSFTTAPFVFTSFKNALNYARLGEDQMIYVLAWAVQGGDIQALKRTVAAQVSGIDVYTTAEFSRKTRYYWMFTTGAGIALLVAALMGFVVGIVVVAQTIYAATLDHLREFGTLKAMGASNTYVCLVIVKQACLSAALGYVPGIAIGFAAVRLGQWSGAPILLPWELAAGLFVLAFVMCIGASLISINKAMHIDPALVLKS